jgi:MFS family permease
MTDQATSLSTAPAASVTTSITARWYVLLMMCLVYTLSIADRYVVSTVLEPMRLELQLSDFWIAALTGTVLALFYVFFGFPVSWLIDRKSRRNIIAISLVAWSVFTTLTGLARNTWQLAVARMGVGFGEAGGTPGASSIISDYFPAARRPMALTIFSLGAPIGAWLGADAAGRWADAHGWRSVFLALGIPGVIAGVIVYLTVTEPRRGCLDREEGCETPSLLETARFLWQQKSAVHLMIGSAITALWGWGLMWWTPTFLVRTYNLTVGQAGALTGPMHLVGGSVATLFTAWLVSRPVMADPRRIMWLMGTVIGLATFASAVVYWTRSLELATVMLWIFIPSIYFYIGPCFGILNNLARPRMRALFCATTLFVANICNLVIAPPFIGFVSDHVAPNHVTNAESLRFAMLCLVPTGFWSAAHYFWGTRGMLEDQKRATGV